jgi:hypothetical protein
MVEFPWRQRRVTERQLIVWVVLAVMVLNLVMVLAAVVFWL